MSYTIDTTTWRSPNYDDRIGVPIITLVIHSCEGRLPAPRETSLPWLCNPASRVSSHYYICRDTSIFQLVDDAREAWHAGVAQTLFQNARSIGIECEHRAGQDWPSAQRDALGWLIATLSARYAIRPMLIETHGQIAIPGPYDRKHDPTDWPHADFLHWRDALFVPSQPPSPPTPIPSLYRVRIRISQRQEGGPPYAGELVAGDVVGVDKTYSNGYAHLADGRGFVPLTALEPV